MAGSVAGVNDLELRRRILRHFADTGLAPNAWNLLDWGIDEPTAALRRLDRNHAVVLDDAGRILMANPFSGVPTPWRVRAGDRRWFANCAWDAVAIPIAVGIDATIEGPWMDSDDEVDLAVVGGEVVGDRGFVHFEVPASHWWDDIVHT